MRYRGVSLAQLAILHRSTNIVFGIGLMIFNVLGRLKAKAAASGPSSRGATVPVRPGTVRMAATHRQLSLVQVTTTAGCADRACFTRADDSGTT